jgi:DNA-binding transcriptional LysR family regulator
MGLLPSLHKMLTVPLFFELRSKYPLIKLQVLEGSGGQIDQWMADSHIDIGITYRYGNRPTSDVDTLATLDSYLIGAAGDRLTQLSEVRFAQLDGLPLVLPQAPSGVRMKLDRVAAQSRVSLNVVFGADSMQIQTEIVKEGGAYTVLPLHAVRSELESGALQATLIVDPPVSRTIALGFGASTVQSKATRIVARLTRTMIMSALS